MSGALLLLIVLSGSEGMDALSRAAPPELARPEGLAEAPSGPEGGSRPVEAYRDAKGWHLVRRLDDEQLSSSGRGPALLGEGSKTDPGGYRPPAVEIEAPDGRRFRAGVGRGAFVRFRRRPSPEDLAALGVERLPVEVEGAHLVLVRDRGGRLDGAALAARISRQAADTVAWVAPDLYLPVETRDFPIPPNDPRYPGQWYLDRIGIEAAWTITAGRPEVVVAVVDNGCDPAHPDLVYSELALGYDAVDEDDRPDPFPEERGNEHGTACAGVAAALGNNGTGIAGACPLCTIQCIRLLPPRGSLIPTSATVTAFERIRIGGAAVASNSWGYVGDAPVPSAVRSAIEALQREGNGGRGTLVVFASGNSRTEIPPDDIAAVEGVVAVSATNLFDELTSFSSFGPAVDLAAPGGTVTTDVSGPDGAEPGDYTAGFGGTSAACPLVAGIGALLFSAAPNATVDDVRAALIAGARPAPFAVPDDNGHDPEYGYGIVDPLGALSALLGPSAPPPDAGVQDADPPDAESRDAETTDAGPPQPAPREPRLAPEVGCQGTPRSGAPVALLMLAGVILRRLVRSRRRPGRPA